MANRIAAMRVLADILQEQEDAKKSGERAGFYMGDFFATYGMSIPEGSDEFTLQVGVSPNVCGTKFCVAGFATLHAGYKLEMKSVEAPGWHSGKSIESVWIAPTGKKLSDQPDWERVGADHLGLPKEEAKILFYSTFDDGEQAIEILTRLANGEEITRTEWAEYGKTGDIDMEGYDYDWTWKEELGEAEERCNCSYCY